MLLTVLATTEILTSPSYVDSFVVGMAYSYQVADWWTSVFGANDDSVKKRKILVLNVRANNIDYTAVNSYEACYDLERSWFISDTSVYVHLDHDLVLEGVSIQYGLGRGFTDGGIVYIDDVEYLPLITQAPMIERSEDIVGYSKLRLISGSLELSNLSGIVDELKNENIIGNDAILSHLPNSAVIDGVAQRADVQDLARYFVESSSLGNSSVKLELQDLRAMDKQVPTRFFDTVTYPDLSDSDEGKVVPLAYGAFRDLQATPVTSKETDTTFATFRACEYLISISEVRVKVRDTWETRIPSSTDNDRGSFTIPNARESTDKAPYECHIDGYGIPVNNAPDIMVDIYNRFLGQAFTSTFYDTTAWTVNKAGIPTCSMVIKEQTTILDIIPIIQNGVYPSFRFDITPQGMKTIARDDRERSIDWFVDSVEILNIDELEVVDNADNLYGVVIVDYDKSQTTNNPRRITVDTYAQSVVEKYQREDTSTPIESLLTNEIDAQNMANAKAIEFSDPVRTISPVLMGERFIELELYDIVQIDTSPGRLEAYTEDTRERELHGILIGQVISIKPDYQALVNTVTLRILDRDIDSEMNVFMVTENSEYITTESNLILSEG